MNATIESLPADVKLYKYRSFNLFTLRMLTNAIVYFSDPADFNDPLDCNPEVSVDLDIYSLENILLKMSPEAVDLIKQYKGCDKVNNEPMKDRYFDVLKSCIGGALRDKVRQKCIFSLAGTWDSPLMWSHYGDEHKGICIEYDVSKCKSFAPPKKVDYTGSRCVKASTLLEWLNGSDSAYSVIEHTSYFTKAQGWHYEQEWRLLSDKKGEKSIPFPISAIYFGMNCDYAIINAVVNLMKSLPLQFFKVSPIEDTFELNRFTFDPEYVQSFKPRSPITGA